MERRCCTYSCKHQEQVEQEEEQENEQENEQRTPSVGHYIDTHRGRRLA